jgi:hypothetical protein
LHLAAADLTSPVASAWRCAFQSDREQTALVLVQQFLAEMTELWQLFPELVRTPFLLDGGLSDGLRMSTSNWSGGAGRRTGW